MALRRGPRDGTVLMGAVVLGVLVLDSCATPDPPADVPSPVETVRPPASARPTNLPDGPAGSVGTPEEQGAQDPVDGAATGQASRSLAQRTLDRYDRALTELLRDPAVARDDGTPAMQRWHAVVDPESGLSADMLATVRRHDAVGTWVEPGPLGLSYLHRVLDVRAEVDGLLSFSWCGYSPGVARSTGSGATVDDGVGHARGTGDIAVEGSTAQLVSLDELDLEVLEPGSPDPCDT